jgi:glycine oxidase
MPTLRGVRGEAVILETSEVSLTRPVRVLHPRYPIYVAPRGPRRFVVGATQVESSSRAPMTVRSALELLTAAYDLAPGFRSAQIVELVADARPTFFDHRPRVLATPGLTRVNGLFRHGFLLGPLVAEVAAVTSLEPCKMDDDLQTLTAEVA